MGTALRSSARPTAVERFLRAEVLWDVSQSFDLDRLRSLLGIASDVAQAASDIAANSGRWIKLTPESAQLVKEYGLMEAKTPGLRHLMVGVPGKVGNWLQTEKGAPLPPRRPDPRSRSGSRSWRTASASRSPSTFWHSTGRWLSRRPR
jgi:hypothetical protein